MPPLGPSPTAAYHVLPWSRRAATLSAGEASPWSCGVQVNPPSTERKKPSVSAPAIRVPLGDCARTLMNPPPLTAELPKDSPDACTVTAASGATAAPSVAPVKERASRGARHLQPGREPPTVPRTQ